MVGRLALLLGLSVCLARPAAAQDPMEKDFKQALQIQNHKELERVCRALVTSGTADNAKLILGGLARPDLEGDTYWILVRASAAFQSSNALNVVAKYVLDNKTKGVARDLCMALHNNFSPPCEEAMCAILTGGSEELRVSALDHLMDIGKKQAVETVVALLKKESKPAPEVSKRCFRMLATLTKKDFGDSVSNWTGWWDANGSKSWGELTGGASGSGGGDVGTTTLGNSRQNDYDKLKEAKVLILRAGDKCKCKKNHDLDNGIDAMMTSQPWKTESITKDKFEHDPAITVEYLSKTYIGIIAICTHIREHCACPNCKPGGKPNMRLFT